jgi:predicted negative regulator of RcsB-dependent stress response
MDEDIEIINTNTRNEKIKNFFIINKKKIITFVSFFILIAIFYFLFLEIKERNKIKLAEKYNKIKIEHTINNKEDTKNKLIEVIFENDATYSPLALYFIIDNEILTENGEINKLFDQVINKTKLDKEIKNLIIYKKALFNSDFTSENELLNILNPIINSESIWKSHALYLVAEYFYSKNEKEKSKEFFNKIVGMNNSNQNIKVESQKRLNRDF